MKLTSKIALLVFFLASFAFMQSCTSLKITNSSLIKGDMFVKVQGGEYYMGTDYGDEEDEKPSHKVNVNSFYLSKYEVTNKQFIEFLEAKGKGTETSPYYAFKRKGGHIKERMDGSFYVEEGYNDHPANNVTWIGATAFAEWVGGRLPTEAEWEYAAKGGAKSKNLKFSGSDIHTEVAWSKDDGISGPQKVGQKKANELGLFDMNGNVWEWCRDTYNRDYYKSSPSDNPVNMESGASKLLRGGSFLYGEEYLHLTCRLYFDDDDSYENIGFRVLIPIK